MIPGSSEGVCGPGDTAFGTDELDSTGTPPDIATQPINKYGSSAGSVGA